MVHGDPEDQVLDHLRRTLEGGPLEDTSDHKTAQSRQQQAKLKFRQQLMGGAPTVQDEATIRELGAQLADGQDSRSAESTGRCAGRNRRTFSLNQVMDPVHSTRSAITVAGIDGCSASNSRTRASKGENDIACDLR